MITTPPKTLQEFADLITDLNKELPFRYRDKNGISGEGAVWGRLYGNEFFGPLILEIFGADIVRIEFNKIISVVWIADSPYDEWVSDIHRFLIGIRKYFANWQIETIFYGRCQQIFAEFE